jgi:hypothetical protein
VSARTRATAVASDPSVAVSHGDGPTLRVPVLHACSHPQNPDRDQAAAGAGPRASRFVRRRRALVVTAVAGADAMEVSRAWPSI